MKLLITLIILIAFSSFSYGQEKVKMNIDRAEVEMQYIRTAKNYDQLQRLLSIMPSNSPHWNYIPSIFPIKTTSALIRRGFGYLYHPIDHVKKFHYAIDIPCALAENVYSTASGIVSVGFDRNGYGHYITIDHANGFETLYGHLSAIVVKKGQYVKKGQIIGLAGATGKATGVHVHYAVRKDKIAINPYPFCYVSSKQYLKERKIELMQKTLVAKKTDPVIKPGQLIDTLVKKKRDSVSRNGFLEQSFF
ncbi:murein DD-endopeptidase MepM/ murein hydrolase activator NlpD [Pedobacter sp. CG_S7]|uniref:M23 family metallopeptidase n=1 Tax=Pedobacter sp. CG_S7 TaxID=3143930 RepID=UPI00339AD607